MKLVSLMDLLPVFEWLQRTPVSRVIRDSSALVAGIEAVHLIGLCLLGGTILMVNLSLLGLGPRREPVAGIARDLEPWTNRGLGLMFLTGPLLFLGEAVKCYSRESFWVKMAVLIVALAFHFRVQQRVAKAEPPAGRWRAASVGLTSLGL